MPSENSSTATSAATPVVAVSDLTRSFGPRRAVAGVSFTLLPGECLALFGPNGAGKTTLLRVLAGLLKPTSGNARVSGIELPGGALARGQVGLISHHTMLYEALSPRENVAFAARLYGIRDASARVDDALRRMAMIERADAPVRSLSRGMQQRVSIARAMVHSPRLVLADEPYSGLDESGARSLTALLEELRSAGTAIVIVTHNLVEGLALATRAAVMKAGKFVRTDAAERIDRGSYAVTYREALAAGG
ncbi:MAG TPA: heme ABC exporter ATP-binding protein CcmA [Gemmatimonadaceae bacterium]|jgi:heme exporter protein A|nr:heme ABC exporter ATP-binding protein CcmA [Gemmatimonadaceae bacterium]